MLSLFRFFLIALLQVPYSNAIGQEGWWATAEGSSLDFNYQEYGDQGNLLDKESGVIPGLVVEIGKDQNQWRFSGKLACHAGDVGYSGQTNGGVPISTFTKQQIAELELRTDYTIEDDTRVITGIHISAARHYWNRDIQPTRTPNGTPVMGLLEKYHWWQLNMGASARLLSTEHSRWLLDVRLSRIFTPHVTVNYSGLYDDSRVALGGRWGTRISLPWSYSLGPSSTLLIEPYMERYELGRSATVPLSNHGVPIGSVFEPNSVNRSNGLLMGVRRTL